MTKEDLFEAIGTVEISRLAKSEQGIEALYCDGLEEPTMKKTAITAKRVLRNLLAAAVIVSLLAVTAYAVAGYVLYDNPEDLISSIFGDKTGFDHKPYTEVPMEDKPGHVYGQPEYNRVEADEKVVREDVAPYVSPVGKSISFKGMTLTVDSFLYDSGTKCGVVTYTLTNPPKYQLSYDGRLYFEGRDGMAFSQYGYDYVIREKTTEDTLAAAYYFQYDPQKMPAETAEALGREQEFSVRLYLDTEEKTVEKVSEECAEEVRRLYTPEEAIGEAKALYREAFGEEIPEIYYPGYESESDGAYRILRDRLLEERYDWREVEARSTSPDKIVFDCSQNSGIENIAIRNSGVILSPISLRADVRDMDFLGDGDRTDAIDEIIISFADGTDYLVEGDNADGNSVENRLFAVWSPVEVKENADNVILTIMFNRVIDLEQVISVRINGTELTRN